MNTVPSYNYSTEKSKEVDIHHDEEIEALQQRCTQLESRCTALESLTATHTSVIADLERRVTALEG